MQYENSNNISKNRKTQENRSLKIDRQEQTVLKQALIAKQTSNIQHINHTLIGTFFLCFTKHKSVIMH